ATKRPLNITSKRYQNPLHSKHAPPPAKPSPLPRNPILISVKHALPLTNPKSKAPKLKASDVTESDQGDGSSSEEGDDSGSEEEEDEKEGDEEEDEKEGDDEEDEEEGDEEDDEEKVDEEEDEREDEENAIVKDKEYEEEEEKVSEEEEEEEEDVNVKGNKRGRKGKGGVMMSKGKKIKVEDKEKKTKGKGKGPSKPTKKVFSDNQIRREKFLSEYSPLLSRTVPSLFFHAIRDAKVNMKSFMEDIGFSALHLVNIDTLPNRLARFVVRAFDSKTYNFYLKTRVVHVTAEKVHEILGLPIGGISLYDLPERREYDEFVQLWLSQFAPKKKKQILATDIAEKLVRSTRVDFMFKVNFLMLFANVMGKADTKRAFVNLLVVRCIRENTNIVGVDWCDFIHRCLAISHESNTVSGFYNVPLCFLIIICEMIEEKLSSISKKKAEVETLLRDENKEFPNDDNVKQLFEQYKGFFKETVLLEEAKAHKAPQNVKPKPAAVKTEEAAEKPKEPAEKAQKAPQNVKLKPAAVKTKEAAEKPMPDENVKELAENPKEPAGDDYQVVPAATVMKVKDREEFEVETFTLWIEGNIDWVGEKKLFSRYLKEQNHSSHEAIAKMRPFIPKLKWRTSNNHVDCGVFAMIHMDNYVGNAAKNWEFGLCEESDEQLSMLQRMRYKIATKIMLHQFNDVSNKMFDFAFTFETTYTEQARVSMIVDAIKNRNNRDPPKQVKETDAANVFVGVNEVVDQVKEKRRRKK
nr:ubiquitin-specific protease 13 [Tanacetum cinerariifolium]